MSLDVPVASQPHLRGPTYAAPDPSTFGPADRFTDDSPYELNTNDAADSIFNDIFKRRGDIFAHFDREYRLDAEEKTDLEVRNSGHATGATRRFANDVIGKSGPTLQVMTNEHY